MARSNGFCICSLAGQLSPSQFTPVSPGDGWLGMNLLNDSAEDVALRTNPDDASTEYVIPATGQFQIQAGYVPGNTALRFQGGMTAFWLKTTSGDGTGVRVIWA